MELAPIPFKKREIWAQKNMGRGKMVCRHGEKTAISKEHQRLPANHQKLREKHGIDPSLCSKQVNRPKMELLMLSPMSPNRDNLIRVLAVPEMKS